MLIEVPGASDGEGGRDAAVIWVSAMGQRHSEEISLQEGSGGGCFIGQLDRKIRKPMGFSEAFTPLTRWGR